MARVLVPYILHAYNGVPRLGAPVSTLSNNAPSIGACISHYRILTLLGKGGMGAVYEAEDQVLGRHIALKLLPRELCSDHLALERFQREARAASALNHPNICTVYEISEWQGEHFIALELLEGERLKDRIGNHPLSPNCVLDYGIQIADALDAAHRKGVIHRDVTPTNIFVTRSGQAKLLDFGLAKLVADERDTLNSSIPTSPSDNGLTSPGPWVRSATCLGAGAGGGTRRAFRPVLFRGGPVRNGHRKGSLLRQHIGGHLRFHLEPAASSVDALES